MITGEKIAVLAGLSVFAVLAFTLATRGATARTPRPGGPAKGSAAAAKLARSLFDGFRDLYSESCDLTPTDASRFPDLDIPWLDARAAEALGEGMRSLGDYHLPRLAARDPKLKGMFRAFASADGRQVLLFMCHRYRHGIIARLLLRLRGLPRVARSWQVQTYFRDGRMLTIGTNPGLLVLDPLPGNKIRCLPPTDSWQFGLELHRKELSDWLETKPESDVLPVTDAASFLDRERAIHARSCEHRRAEGYVTPNTVRNMLRLNRPFADQVVVELEHIQAEERAKGTIPPAPADVSSTPDTGISA